ncbi:hypothetical protein QBC33DRAFT_450571 [Phialemonium atrogriseum]|uniref:FAD-binding FR-type domain-containing protein n=1 Tax=Phialemonium atrogriseum TaxID=1093897 RepID=A0AAJ0C0H5_9PEZI|nr:uncharacterized protein QBC33DRAFT_450571 [Phialemonium atrogriseum]KAK1767695.1 hypothetical protein QBC33DRAFT_450571 [Phialemonium atrogriseum]
MATLHEFSTGWHPGEQAIHNLLRVPTSQRENPTAKGLPAPYAYRVASSSLVAFGTLDEQGRPWTTVWGGERTFTRPVAQDLLGVQCLVDRRHDPVVQALLGSAADGELVRPMTGGIEGKVMSALSIDLETRDRVKLAGRMAVGTVASKDGNNPAVGEVQMAMLVQESLGNCPKYLNKKEVTAHVPLPELVSDTLPLPKGALELIDKADMFFLSSTNGQTMDTNHRGGPPGFVRVVSNAKGGVVIVYPEYSGNRLYQTLGNLYTNPNVGIAIPDFDSSNVLFLRGETELLVGRSAAALLAHAGLAVKITVKEARFVKDGLSFRGKAGESSPYNPPVRPLVSEQQTGAIPRDQGPVTTATLVEREVISPTVSRYVFKLQPGASGRQLRAWKPGQHVTLDFSAELDDGWRHMCDDDPQSLNDDFVRTFTISNPPPSSAQGDRDDAALDDETELEITVRKHGPATTLLAKHNIRVPLELPVLGFGGEGAFRIPAAGNGGAAEDKDEKLAVFVAGGVGITPLLAQAPGLLAALGKRGDAGFRVLWSLRSGDLFLAVHTFEKVDGLARFVKLFVTGKIGEEERDFARKTEDLGAQVFGRRMERGDVLGAGSDGMITRKKYYLCTNPAMLKVLLGWLGDQETVSENFNY